MFFSFAIENLSFFKQELISFQKPEGATNVSSQDTRTNLNYKIQTQEHSTRRLNDTYYENNPFDFFKTKILTQPVFSHRIYLVDSCVFCVVMISHKCQVCMRLRELFNELANISHIYSLQGLLGGGPFSPMCLHVLCLSLFAPHTPFPLSKYMGLPAHSPPPHSLSPLSNLGFVGSL